MCNLSTGILDRGRAEGRAEGRLEGILETLFGLVEDGILLWRLRRREPAWNLLCLRRNIKNIVNSCKRDR